MGPGYHTGQAQRKANALEQRWLFWQQSFPNPGADRLDARIQQNQACTVSGQSYSWHVEVRSGLGDLPSKL
jgi:hypothetical protein